MKMTVQVETPRLNEQGKRNIKRFPTDFMFQISQNELITLQSQNATANVSGIGYEALFLK